MNLSNINFEYYVGITSVGAILPLSSWIFY